MENNFYRFYNLSLSYSYSALEPFIDEETMMLHHGAHLQSYIDKLNKLLDENPYLQKYSLEELITESAKFPENTRNEVRYNAGGVYNHRLYFDSIEPDGLRMPYGRLSIALTKKYENYDAFKEEFKKAALSVPGSGYVWLVIDNGELKIITTSNQNTPIMFGMCPIITMDVWEHAYYLKHYNKRGDYVDDWFNVINWYFAEKNYLNCIGISWY